MKAILISIVLLFSLLPEWMTNFDDASAVASKENKMILLNFSGSDWCAPCIKMKRDVFESDTFMQFADQNLVLLRADFPRLKKNQPSKEQVQRNEAMAEKYNPQGKFPLTVLLDVNGKVIKEWDGYSNQSADNFVTELQAIIRQ